jgi:hypothetical protein
LTRRRKRRRRSSGPVDWVGASAAAGAVIGLLIAVSHASHRHATVAGCPHGDNAGGCVGKALGKALAPYVTDGVGGLILGAIVGVLLLLTVALGKRVRGGFVRKRRCGSLVSRQTFPMDAVPPPVHGARESSPRPRVRDTAASAELSRDELLALRVRVREAILVVLRDHGGTGQRRLIFDRALALGGFTARELSALPVRERGSLRPRVDYEMSWALTNLKRDGLIENPARNVWQLSAIGRTGPEPAVGEPVADERIQELRLMPYREYLQTLEWKTTRAAALMRAGHRCSLDSSHRDGLEVHHNTYERMGAELASDLVVLCRECHQRHHHAPQPG